MAKILIVDDEEDLESLILQRFRRNIRSGEFQFIFARNGIQALDAIKENPDVDMVFSDINMPEMDGLTLLDQLNQTNPNIKAVIVSAYEDMDNIRTAMNRGAFDFVTKPINFDDLEVTIRRTLSHLQMLRSTLEVRSKLIGINQELKVASNLQQSIVPKKFINNKELQLYATMQPATEVGGDFYDFFWLDKTKLGVVMADVSGKGVSAALFMAVARTHLKAIAPYCKSAAECLMKLNNHLAEDNETSMFVTTFYGILDTQNGEFSYANGGHCLPILFGENNIVELQSKLGIAVGVFEDADFSQEIVTLKPGESIFLYTDGITEAMNVDNEEFGMDRLTEVFKEKIAAKDSMEEIVQKVVSNVREYAGKAPQSDDITCLSLRFQGVQA